MPRQVFPASLLLSSAQRACCCLLLLLLAVLPHTASADLFYRVEKVIKLTDLNPAANGSIPITVTGLNNTGRMTGFFPSSNANKLHAFVWDDAGQSFTDLNALLAADSSMATCVNEQGTVAGVFWELGNYAEKGFVYHADGTVSTFTGPDAAHGAITHVTAINPNGSIIGTYVASDSTTRGFIIQNTTAGSTIADLGDLGANATYKSYLWPNALNTANQVVGNVYLFRRTGHVQTDPSYTKAFFWDTAMTAIDASALGPNWTAIGLNSSGLATGLYDMATGNMPPFSAAGSYVWDGNDAIDVGDLGGGQGANAFSIRDSGLVLGTSLSTDGELHLFQYGCVRPIGMTDLGGVSVFSGDASFLPLGISAVSVMDEIGITGTGLPETLDLVGLGTDASGNTRSLLWKDGGIHSVIDLMPAYLSFRAISHAYGSMVFINNSEQIACAGIDAAGQQMALLLSIDPDTDNNGLPDSWEMQYYGHTGVDKTALEAGGGGLTNWLAYQQGSDPNDFYNGQAPQITIVSGNSQEAAPSSFVPLPLIVQVSNANGLPAAGVPVKFIASGGGQLQRTNVASPKPTVSINTDSDGQAKVFYQVSDQAHTAAQVYAQVTAGSFTAKTRFDETSNDGDTTPPNPMPTDPNNPIDPNDPNNLQEVPTQSYACIDISGDVATSNVTHVTLNDQGNAAFGFVTGTSVFDATGPTQFHSYAWQNGTLGSERVTDLEIDGGPGDNGDQSEIWTRKNIGTLFSNGQVCGSIFTADYRYDEEGIYDLVDIKGISASLFGVTPTDLTEPFVGKVYGNNDGPVIYRSSENGSFVGTEGITDNHGHQWLVNFVYKPDGTWVVFPHGYQYDASQVPQNVTVQNSDFFGPFAVNKNGWFLAARSEDNRGILWKGDSSLTYFGNDSAEALNDQGQVVVRSDQEGYLWENGTPAVLVNHLPRELAGKIQHIQPFSISNQTEEGTDATIYILANAQVNGSAATIVCTRDNDGDWSFEQVQPPEGATVSQYVTINSNGNIAGLGSISESSGMRNARYLNDDPSPSPSPTQNALLMKKADISIVFGYNSYQVRGEVEESLTLLEDHAYSSIPPEDIHTFYFKGKDSRGKAKEWMVQTSTNQDSLLNALKTTPYVFYDGHSNDGAGFALKKHAADPDFDPASIHGIDDFLHLRNPQVSIPWGLLHDEYPNFGINAVPAAQIVDQPRNYDVTVPFSRSIVDGYKHRNKERYPNNPNASNVHVGAGQVFPSPTDNGIERHHMTRRLPPEDESGSGGDFGFLVVNVDNSVKPTFGYKIFCAKVCYGARDYGQVFNHSCFITTIDAVRISSAEARHFVTALIQGKNSQQVMAQLNEDQDVFTQTNH